MMTEEKTDWSVVNENHLGDGLHFTKRRSTRGRARYISVNGNASTTVETMIKTIPPPFEVSIIATQEMRVADDEINDVVGKYRRI